MAARLSIMLFLLEEEKKRDDLAKRRQAYQIRKFLTISRQINFIKQYRLIEDLIITLENDLKPFLPVSRRSSGLSRRLKILCTLSFLATGSYQKIISSNVETYISQSSASRAIHQVVDALNNREIIRKYIRFPQNANERQSLKKRFYEKFNIPGVLGCIDGTLVSMIRPRENEERYYCRRGYHARKYVLIINDANVAKIVAACCVLHNICNRARLAAPELASTDVEEENRILRILLGSQNPLKAWQKDVYVDSDL